MHRISLKGVAVGNITDIAATYLVALPLIAVIVVLSEGTAVRIAESILFYILYAILGGLCSVLGGYVAARIAKHDELLNGALSSILCVVGGTYAVISGLAANDLLMHLLFLPLSPALGALGGFLRASRLNS
jgi:hypothetical protein